MKYARLIVVYGSPHAHGCLSGLAAQPDMTIAVVVSALNCMSRTYVSGAPPKMPSTSPDACACAESPQPSSVGTCQRT